MRYRLVPAALLLPLAGCYVPPQPAPAYGYAAPGYPAPEYAPESYAPDPYAVQAVPGFSYNNGAPTIIEGGVTMPLVLYGGEWGYYDRGRQWHRAPDHVYRQMQQYPREGWGGHPGGPPPHFEGRPPPRYDGRPPQAYEGHPPPGAGRYGGPPPDAGHYGGPPPGVGRYGGPPPGRPPEAMRPVAAPYQPPRPAPPPQAAQQQQHEHNRACPFNQKC